MYGWCHGVVDTSPSSVNKEHAIVDTPTALTLATRLAQSAICELTACFNHHLHCSALRQLKDASLQLFNLEAATK